MLTEPHSNREHVTELFYIKRRHRWQLGRNLKLSQNININIKLI